MCLRPLYRGTTSDFDTEQKRITQAGDRPDLVPLFWWFHDVGRSFPVTRIANKNGASLTTDRLSSVPSKSYFEKTTLDFYRYWALPRDVARAQTGY